MPQYKIEPHILPHPVFSGSVDGSVKFRSKTREKAPANTGSYLFHALIFSLVYRQLFHDSNGGPATPPPIGQNGGGGGGDTDPPPVTPPKTVTRIDVVGAPTNFSSEGKAPDLTGITSATVWYSDGGVDFYKDSDAVKGAFKTIPSVLSRGNLTPATGAANPSAANPQQIYIYHNAYPGQALTPVTLPGVRAIERAASANAAKYSSTGPLKYDVWGSSISGSGIFVTGALTKSDYFEDDDPPDFAGIQVFARYRAAWDPKLTTPGLATTGSGAPTPAGEWELLPLTADHIFVDYRHDFLTAAASSSSRYFAYGIDPVNKPTASSTATHGSVNILISKDPALHGGATTESIIISVPFDASKYHYVRAIELSKPLAWKTTYNKVDYNFLIQTALSGRSDPDWAAALITAGISPRVYYYDYAEYKDRTPEHFRRAVALNRAGVTNTLDLDPESDNFGLLAIGYYTSALDDNGYRTPISKGDFTNAYFDKVPIATPVEDTGKFVFQEKAFPKDRNLPFISFWPAGTTTGVTTVASTPAQMEDQQLATLQRTYDFAMDFVYESQTVPAYVIIPGEDFRKPNFDTNPFYLRPGSEVELNKEVTFRVLRTAAAIQTALDGSTTISAKATRYALVASQEATFEVDLYPPGYDKN